MNLMMYMPGMMDGPMGGWGGFWWPFMLVHLLVWGVFVSLLAWFAVRVFSKGRGPNRPGAARDSAEEILRERFARGDISAEEYQRALEILRTGTARRASEQDPACEPREPDDHGDETS